MAAGAALLILIAWFAQFVSAEKEANVYVFPSYVYSEGWEGDTNALGQELSQEAGLADFSPANSAYISFGEYFTPTTTPPTESTSPEGSNPTSPEGDVLSEEPNVLTPPEVQEPPATVGAETPSEIEAGTLPNASEESPASGEVPAENPPEAKADGAAPPESATPSPIEASTRRIMEQLFAAETAYALPLVSNEEGKSSQEGATTTATTTAPTEEPLDAVEIATPDASTSPEEGGVSEEVTRVSDDPHTFALCTILARPCHLMEFAGFGLGGALSEKPLRTATLEISLAGHGHFTGDRSDRVVVSLYHGGRWESLGEFPVEGEFSNAYRGGYLSLPLRDVLHWGELNDLKVVVEYVEGSDLPLRREEGAAVYVDGIWINARYETLELEGLESPEDLALTSSNVRSSLFAGDIAARKERRDKLKLPEGGVVSFAHSEAHENATLAIKTDIETYYALGNATAYFNVTNEAEDAQIVRLQFYFPHNGGEVDELSRFANNIPHTVGAEQYAPVGYFCASGWSAATSSEGATGEYHCAASGELKSCDALNDEATNCIHNNSRIGVIEDIEYRDGWLPVPLARGSFREEGSVFARAIELLLGELPEDAIPESETPIAYAGETFLIEPGQTLYFRASVAVPLNSRGDFYIEAATESGHYGLVSAEWDGSWNHRVSVDVDHSGGEVPDGFPVALSLDALPASFWSHVNVDGSDVRFVSEAGEELPYWLSGWDAIERHALAWVRIPKPDGDQGISRIHLYYGNTEAPTRSDEFAPFVTESLTLRGVVVGDEEWDTTVLALAPIDGLRLRVGRRDEITLKKGESALIDRVRSGERIYSNGPVVLAAKSGAASADVIPFGFAGTSFVIPGVGGERHLSLTGVSEAGSHAEVRSGGAGETVDVIPGRVVGMPVMLDQSALIDSDRAILVGVDTGDAHLGAPLYPSTEAALYGFAVGKIAVGFTVDGSAMVATCSSGPRKEVDGRREGATSVLNHCPAGSPELADTFVVRSNDTAIGTLEDIEGSFLGALPRKEFASSYLLPEEAKSVMIACAPEDGTIAIGIFDGNGRMAASTTCEALGTRPGKAYLAATEPFALGSVLRALGTSTKIFLAAFEGNRNLLTESKRPISLLRGAPLFRTPSPEKITITLGAEEFVVPGEHRTLDVTEEGKEKKHVNRLLSTVREFTIRERPSFAFQYIPQSSGFMQGVRELFDIAPFTVSRVTLRSRGESDRAVAYDIAYGENNEWRIILKADEEHLRPGKYTLLIEMEEGGETLIDEFDFFWGVLAINFDKTVYEPNETVDISLAALSDTGNTICDARLKLWVADPNGNERDIPVSPSGECKGNNVVFVPDYSATYVTALTGTYRVRLARLDHNDNVASEVVDAFTVEEHVPYEVRRVGPTRIYPVAHYPMQIIVHANEDFRGDIVERVPGDFVFIDRGNADLKWADEEHTAITATWSVDMKAGDEVQFSYTFDAPDRSPFVYLLGPLSMEGDGGSFTELRQWQIASDAAGKMMIFWEESYIPTGWTCVSCLSSDPFYRKFVVGSSTYGGGSGSATHLPSASATVFSTTATGVGPVTTTNTNNAPLSHSHTLTPQFANVSNLPSYRQLQILQANTAGDPATIPAGAILMFDVASSSLPSGWLRYDVIDGRYPYAENVIGSTGGSNTHAHAATGTLSNASGSGLRSQNPTASAASVTHNHTLSATTTDMLSSEPPYIEVLFAKLSATSSPQNYAISMWNDTPPSGFVTLSNSGGAFSGRYPKGAATYGGTGGSSTHTHANMTAATTSAASATNLYNADAANGQAPGTHTHQVDISSFSTDSHLPPSIDVIFAKRLSGIVVWEQEVYRWYVNANVNTPTDPWPVGGTNLSESEPITSASIPVRSADRLRLRMSLLATNATSTVGAQKFKLQYVAADDCAFALNWSDVGAIGSTTAAWRGYDNNAVTNNADLPSTLLLNSDVAESYVEQNNSTGTAVEIGVGKRGEWDWVLQSNNPAAGSNYCFRMVKDDGSPLDTYTDYPKALTNQSPETASLLTLFDNEKTGTTTPDFTFVATDPELDDIDYRIQISTTPDFATPVIDQDSTINPEYFDNITDPVNKAPFTSGETIHFHATAALTNGTTYWWRVRAIDAGGSNGWNSWSGARSFTVDTTVTVSTWFQTTRDQFLTDTLWGATTTGADNVELISGSTTGSIWSSRIDFSIAATGTAWGSFSWTHDVTTGSISYQVEYLDATSTWVLVPNTDLPGNISGFTSSPVSLLSVDPSVYPTLRLRANLVNSGGTPRLLDWTLAFGYKVTTPAITTPFDNAKVSTTTPYFQFSSTDPQGDAITYQISWSTTPSFTASTTRTSDTHSGFQNITTPPDNDPFNSGNIIRYTIQSGDALTNGTTYYYRIRAKDPSGANDWSFWSTTRSFTVDTSIIVATWFQTATGQFDTDTLTSMYNFGVGSSTVATTTADAMFAYGEGTTQSPQYRIWNGSVWGGALSAQSISATVHWVILRPSTILGEYILGTLGSDRDVNLQVYRNGTWGDMLRLTGTAPSVQRRSLDVAYETLSGRAMAVACDGDADPSYSIWNGSAWGSVSSINLASSNNCEWVRLAANPISNELILLARDSGVQYEAQVWNATTSSWGNSTTLGSMTEAAHEGMAVEYETSGQQALIVTSDGNNNDFLWSAWNGSSWSAAATQALGDDFESGNLTRDKTTDNLALCYIDHDNDIGVVRWTGAAWVAFSELSTDGTTKDGRPVDCSFETTLGRTGFIMAPYGDTTGTRYRYWDGAIWQPQANINTIGTTITDQLRRTGGDLQLGIFFDHTNNDYLFSHWNGSSWSLTQTLSANASVTAAPYGEPFMLAAKNPATQGTIVSTPFYFSDGNAPAWDKASWSVSASGGSSFKVQVQYYKTASSTWVLVPDSEIPGNSTGTSTSPIDLKNLNTTTYAQLRLVGNAFCNLGTCPVLHDWTVEWAQGINVSGIAREHDLVTNVVSGTVAVAVNGAIQTGKTGTITNGNWTISNVTIFPNEIVEVFISGASDTNEAVAIAKYTGPGDFGGISLYERWVTLGSASTTGQTLSLTDLSLYDNSVSSNEDIFFDVTAGGDYNNCASGTCSDSSLYVKNNIFRPSSAAAKTINTWDTRIDGTLTLDANTWKAAGSWRNQGTLNANTSTVVFNGPSGSRTIDSSGAALPNFNNVTFGESGNTATWDLSTALHASGTLALNFGTLSQGAQSLWLDGDLSIGASGGYIPGTATTTFSGSASRTWSDASAAKQNMGYVLVDGSAKTLSLSSGVKATNVTIGADDTLSLGGSNTLTVLGNWINNGTFTGVTGTVAFATTTTSRTINQGSSSFYNLSFTGAGGEWRWLNTNATTSNDITINSGTVTLPGGTLAVGGSFNNSGGSFVHNSGVVRFTATASGKNVRANGSLWSDLIFAGSGGGWTFLDTNATASQSVLVSAGTPVFPSGTFEIGNNFVVSGGAFTANGSTVRMSSTLLSRTITLLGSSLANLFISGSGTFTISDTNATATADVIVNAGTLTLPSGTLSVGGSFVNSASFLSGSGLVSFEASSGSKTINPGLSPFYDAKINGAGSFTVAAHATSTHDFTLKSAGGFTLSSGSILAVGGTFFHSADGSLTTWAGSTLKLYSGGSYTLNSKSAGGDAYGSLELSNSMQIRMWDSSAFAYNIPATASLYSQDHGGISGAVDIFGAYTRTGGADYWSAETDFDGAALSGANRRAVAVRFESGASALFSNSATLEIVGTSTATTTIDRRSSGNYGITVASSTLNARYYQFRNMDATGLSLTASTTVTSLDFGDFSLDVNGGSSLSVASTTIDKNPGLQIFNVKFATSSGISAGYNVTETGSPSSYWRFRAHYGNYSGESYDNDPGPAGGNPGFVRWDDSNFSIAISGFVYADAGITPMGAPTCDNATPVVRVKVDGAGNYAAPCDPANGSFTVSGVAFSGDTVMTVYLDTGGGARAVTVTRSAVADITDMKLYNNRVIVRHEDVTPITIAHMNAYDSVDDPDIPFTASVGPDTLSTRPETELWIWNGKTFVPGGDITLLSGGSGANWDGTFHIDNNATFTGGDARTYAVGGRWVADSGATFTSASSTFVFTATTTGKSITGVSALSFWNMSFTGAGGNWAINQTTTVGSGFSVATGTVSGASNVTVHGTNVTGYGTIAMTGGTFTLQNGGTFGGVYDWTFGSLTLGSGAIATTTKTASSTITVSNVLTIATNHVLQAGTSTYWVLSGGGTPFAKNGTLNAETSLFRYATANSATPAGATYWRLEFASSFYGAPTYTLPSAALVVNDLLTIGNASSSIVVNADTNDPPITLSGNMVITTAATFTASSGSTLTARGNWQNGGTFTASGGTVLFDASATGKTIAPGNSAFANVTFNNAAGGWTILEHATATANFTLTAASAFTLASGKVLEVGGVFTNALSAGATTWSGSTLYLNSGGASEINTKTSTGDRYEELQIGANTKVRMWNSSATTTVVVSSGSLYSQDHDAVDGDLYIWGSYTRSSGSDYWNYATDFDGVALSGGARRTANVRLASSSSVTLSGGTLEIVGTSTATTTIDRQTTGSFALSVTGGSLNAQNYSVRNANANGLNISGTPTITNLSEGDFRLDAEGGAMITVAGATIDANPLKTFFRNRFATGTGVTSGFNVKATGVSASAWRFNLHEGDRSGEAYDSDPGGDPGYIIWDDSAALITISGNVYSDEGGTPIGAPTCDGVTQNVRLRVQGLGSYTSACNAGTGAYSISNIIFNPGDTLTVYLDTGGGARAVNVSVDPATNIANMDLYRDRVIVRHEQGNPITIAAMNQYDSDQDTDIPFTAQSSPARLFIPADTGFIIWTQKTFAPGGDVTVHANALGGVRDGTVKLQATSTWSSSGAQSHIIGGSFYAAAGASVVPANSTFLFNATTTGRVIAASSSLTFYALSIGGVGGSWDIGGVGTTSNDLTFTAGTTTLPSGTLAVGGSFDNSGGAFVHNGGVLRMSSTASGRNIRAGSSSFNELVFAGAGGEWTMLDTNATTTGSVTITAGNVIFSAGVLAVGRDFNNVSGTFSAGGGTIAMTATSSGRIMRFSGSSPEHLVVRNAGVFSMADTHATTTGNMEFLSGTTTLPTGTLTVGGSFFAPGAFDATTSLVTFNAASGMRTINPGASAFFDAKIKGAGGFTIAANATATRQFTIATAGSFILSSGATLSVGGTFANQVGGGGTTWDGSTLRLYSGTTYALNSKSSGGDGYGTLELSPGTNVSMWNSSSTNYTVLNTSSLYSQNHGAVSGSLYIFGNYVRTSGTEHWSYATDFDGTALGGSSRQANIRLAAGASTTISGSATLAMVGTASATTTVDRQTSGNFGILVDGATINASYYSLRNMNTVGLHLASSVVITSLDYGDVEVAVTSGTGITMASSTVNQNASTFISNMRFATSSAIAATNVTVYGTTGNAITLLSSYGNLSGEAYDVDGVDQCGSIRWSDSSCLVSDQRAYRWRNDDGGEGAPASEWYSQSWSKRKRVRIVNTVASTLSDVQVKMEVPYDADMQSDFDDIRFTDFSGTTSIPYWTESYLASATATVWVKVPTLPSLSAAEVYLYYGNAGATSASSGTSTFKFFDDFEDNNITEYSGNTSLFANNTGFNYERAYGLSASAGNETAKTTDGIGQVSAGVGRDTTFRYFQYIDMSTGASDEPCFLFAQQSPITSHQNYGVCLSPFGADHLVIARDVSNNGRNDGSTQLATKSVTLSTGWYETRIDWIASGNEINVSVYDSGGSLFATTSATSTTYTSGGVGFSFWGQHGGWDIPSAAVRLASSPTISFGIEQTDSGATWKAAENTLLSSLVQGISVRLRLLVNNTGLPITDQNFRLQVASKGAAPNCESVSAANYSDVPTNTAGCGTSPACIKASSQFSDKASTTQLLSTPSGSTFTYGQMLEDPSNQTGNISLASSVFTEVEYNLQMTAYAVADRYCFRTTNAGVALDNYTKVAELTMLQAPVISDMAFNANQNIALTEGTTTLIRATSTVTDLNGYADLVAATSTFWRSSVAGGSACTANNNNCYQIASTSCGFSACSGNSCLLTCQADVYFFADPTDSGSPFASDVWWAKLDVWDLSGSHTLASSSEELYTLRAFTATSSINYGSVVVGSDTGSQNASTTIVNTGNSILNLNIGGDYLRAGASAISYDQEKYATTTFTYSSCTLCRVLAASSTPAYFPLGLAKPTTTLAVFEDIFWGIGVPLGTAAAVHEGRNELIAVE